MDQLTLYTKLAVIVCIYVCVYLCMYICIYICTYSNVRVLWLYIQTSDGCSLHSIAPASASSLARGALRKAA